MESVMESIYAKGRDNARTPMQWSDAPQAGFTTGTPWLKINENYRSINVASQEHDPDSVLNYYRSLTALRKSPDYREVFTYGAFQPAYEDTDSIMAYYRILDNRRILVAGNFGTTSEVLPLEQPVKKLLLANEAADYTDTQLTLKSGQVIVAEL